MEKYLPAFLNDDDDDDGISSAMFRPETILDGRKYDSHLTECLVTVGLPP